MSLPAAAIPLAVLVLAWDETTPAVRALVAASETALPLFDSVVVLVPTGAPGAEEMSQEEFLPLEALPELPGPSSPASAPEITPIAPAAAAPATGPSATLIAPDVARVAGTTAALPAAIEAPPETLLPAAASPIPPLAWSVVRVLRLSSFTLPELAQRASQALPQPTWRGDSASPAAPYLGQSAAAVDGNSAAATRTQPTDYEGVTPILALTTPSSGVALSKQPAAPPSQGVLAAVPPNYFLGELLTPAIDAEPDLAPVPLADAEDAPAAAREEPLATDFAAAQADWPTALASLRNPAPLPTPPQPASPAAKATAATTEAGTLTASGPLAPTASPIAQPVQRKFDAPNLNFQVIQYARFAVPVALAEALFEAIYAPAWPTWLAAQELRQRTGRPLVLHVATLAATEDESVETATSWQAELQRQALHRADLILTETPALAHRLRHELGLPAHLVRPVPATDAVAIAQALHTARPRPALGMR